MSELELAVSAGCDPAEEGCEVIEPLVTVEIREDVLEANVPRARARSTRPSRPSPTPSSCG